MKVSVLMAVYNGSQYIQEAIDSVVNQTFEDIELIICDDGSVDSTRKIISLNKSKKLKYIFESHKGKVPAFNKAFAASTGDYICLLAHDDLLPPDSIQSRLDFALSHNAQICCCNGETFGDSVEKRSMKKYKDYEICWDKYKYRICWDNLIPGGLLFISRDLANQIFPIPESLLFEDWWIVFKALFSNSVIYVQNKNLFKYRIHQSNSCAYSKSMGCSREGAVLRNWRRHHAYYENMQSEFLKNPEREDFNELFSLMSCCEKLKRNTVENRMSLPNFNFIVKIGFLKYLMSQLVVMNLYGFAYEFRKFLVHLLNITKLKVV